MFVTYKTHIINTLGTILLKLQLYAYIIYKNTRVR